MSPLIFVSYSHVNAPLVSHLRQLLTDHGTRIWIDHESLQPGTRDWQDAIRTGLRAADAVLYVASPDAIDSVYVHAELNIAHDLKKLIIPFWLEGETWSSVTPFFLTNTQHIDARGSRFESGEQALLLVLRLAVSPPVLPPQPTDQAPKTPTTPLPPGVQVPWYLKGGTRLVVGLLALVAILVGSSAGISYFGPRITGMFHQTRGTPAATATARVPTPTRPPRGETSDFPLPNANSSPFGITVGADQALWFAEIGGNRIGRITTAGQITEFALPNGGNSPRDIANGPDGALWFTEWNSGRIGRITTAGQITEFRPPNAPVETGVFFPSGPTPAGITAGPDQAVWFTDRDSGEIGRITSAGQITMFPLPDKTVSPRGITTGPDGALWFVEATGDAIGRITTDGQIISFSLPNTGAGPFGITTGPDGALWFTENGVPGGPDSAGNRIGRITA
jgi:streptogramin lyase